MVFPEPTRGYGTHTSECTTILMLIETIDKLSLFTPSAHLDVHVPDCALDFSEGTSAVLVVQNRSDESICLKNLRVLS